VLQHASPDISVQLGTYRNWSRVGSVEPIHICVFSGFRRELDENCALLGQPVGPEASLRNYHYSLRHSPEKRGSHFTTITFVKIPPVSLNQRAHHLMRGITISHILR